MRRPRRNVFLAFSEEDRKRRVFRRLLEDLRPHFGPASGSRLWADTDETMIREDVPLRMMGVIAEPDFIILVLSRRSAQSPWARHEFRLGYEAQRRREDFRFLPVVIDRTELPDFVAAAPFVDLAKDYAHGLSRILQAVNPPAGESIVSFDVGRVRDDSTIIGVSSFLSDRLVEHFRRYPEELKRIDRRKFEELVAELFDAFGYNVELTKRTRDGGRDIIAVESRIVQVKYLIECKRPDSGGYVGVRPVRELLGVKSDERATKAILATTAYFSSDALLFFDRHRWELEPKDFRGLIDWIDKYLSLKRVNLGHGFSPNPITAADGWRRR